MIPDIKNILYATDLSENAQHSFGYAASLSDRYGAGITILHVLEDLSPSTIMQVKSIMGEEWWLEAMERNKEDIIAGIRKRLEEFCDEIGSQHATCAFKVADILIAEGQAVTTIIETAADTNSDLIVMGTRGLGALKGALLGSVSRKVLHYAACSVMVVK